MHRFQLAHDDAVPLADQGSQLSEEGPCAWVLAEAHHDLIAMIAPLVMVKLNPKFFVGKGGKGASYSRESLERLIRVETVEFGTQGAVLQLFDDVL